MDLFSRAAHFASVAHRSQTRKCALPTPYIEHPLEVASLVATLGGVSDGEVLAAAVLHDTVEDTATTPADLAAAFGARVASLVAEVTDDKSLPKAARKAAQVAHAAVCSPAAKAIKLADKLSNLRSLLRADGVPMGWPEARVAEYFAWARAVADAGLRGAGFPALEAALEAVLVEGEARYPLAAAPAPPPPPPPPQEQQQHPAISAPLAALFASTPPPPGLAAAEAALLRFFRAHRAAGRPAALLTSGGTLVPLEARMVRFIDNFSTGARGAALAEALLARGYAVAFLHRAGSKRPLLAAVMEALEGAVGGCAAAGGALAGVGGAWARAVGARAAPAAPAGEGAPACAPLLELPFASVTDYLFLLRAAACAAEASGGAPLLVLAAAVSDFYIPHAELPAHKIQSGGASSGGGSSGGGSSSGGSSGASGGGGGEDGAAPLQLRLTPTPKAVAAVAAAWAPSCPAVSFKLETDEALLLEKARRALATGGVRAVVANLLHKRYEEVVLLRRGGGVEILRAGGGGEGGVEEALGIAPGVLPPEAAARAMRQRSLEALLAAALQRVHEAPAAAGE
jgi:uncharacterized membrane protein YgcG